MVEKEAGNKANEYIKKIVLYIKGLYNYIVGNNKRHPIIEEWVVLTKFILSYGLIGLNILLTILIISNSSIPLIQQLRDGSKIILMLIFIIGVGAFYYILLDFMDLFKGKEK